MIIYSSLCIKNECSFSKSNSHFFFWGVETWIWIVELNVEVGGLEFSLLGFGLPGLSSRFRQWLWARWIFGCHLIIAAEVISPDSSKNEVLFAAWCDVTYCLASPHPCCVLKKLFLKYGKLLALAWLKKDSRMSLWVRIILDWTDFLSCACSWSNSRKHLNHAVFLTLWDCTGWPDISYRVRNRYSLSMWTCHFWVVAS